MGARCLLYLLWTYLTTGLVIGAYVPLREYAGQNFFDAWDYYGFYDNTTWGTGSGLYCVCYSLTDTHCKIQEMSLSLTDRPQCQLASPMSIAPEMQW